MLQSMRNLQRLPISVALLAFTCSANAIVSMEDIHLGKPPEGFSGAYELSLKVDDGNTQQAAAATGLKLQWTEGIATNFILGNYEYGESDGVKDKNKGFLHLRHIHQIDRAYAWEAFSQASFNEFTKLSLRALLGGGIRLTLGEVTDKQASYLGLGAFYEHEELDIDDSSVSDTEDVVRANSYLVFKYQFNEHVSLVSSSYFQPSLEDLSDYRAIEDLSLVSGLTKALSLKVGVDIAHDSQPPPGVEKTDTSLKVGLVINF
jgi:putative salt-induced outer membrane protein YdiY